MDRTYTQAEVDELKSEIQAQRRNALGACDCAETANKISAAVLKENLELKKRLADLSGLTVGQAALLRAIHLAAVGRKDDEQAVALLTTFPEVFWEKPAERGTDAQTQKETGDKTQWISRTSRRKL